MADKKQLISYLKNEKDDIINKSVSNLKSELSSLKDKLNKHIDILKNSFKGVEIPLLDKNNNKVININVHELLTSGTYRYDDIVKFTDSDTVLLKKSISDLEDTIKLVKSQTTTEIEDLILDLLLNGADDSTVDKVKKLTSQP